MCVTSPANVTTGDASIREGKCVIHPLCPPSGMPEWMSALLQVRGKESSLQMIIVRMHGISVLYFWDNSDFDNEIIQLY